jgi:formylglycine-generating enzyme required for sulfatase activity
MRASLAFSALLLVACPVGRQWPAETPMIDIAAGEFVLGHRVLACGGVGGTMDGCDSPADDNYALTWFPEISWLPAATAKISAFRMDQHEVTNVQYKLCVERGSCTVPQETELNGLAYYDAEAYSDFPVVHVTQAQASQYCVSQGKRLPNEAEWEWAARGSDASALRDYPWTGAQPPHCDVGGAYHLASAECATQMPAQVLQSQADRMNSGLRDMASNVAEWVADTWHPFAYCQNRKALEEKCQAQGGSCAECGTGEACALTAPCVPNLAICKPGTYEVYQDNKTEWVVRGGSYKRSRCALRLYARQLQTVSSSADVGFRCAQNL